MPACPVATKVGTYPTQEIPMNAVPAVLEPELIDLEVGVAMAHFETEWWLESTAAAMRS